MEGARLIGGPLNGSFTVSENISKFEKRKTKTTSETQRLILICTENNIYSWLPLFHFPPYASLPLPILLGPPAPACSPPLPPTREMKKKNDVSITSTFIRANQWIVGCVRLIPLGLCSWWKHVSVKLSWMEGAFVNSSGIKCANLKERFLL